MNRFKSTAIAIFAALLMALAVGAVEVAAAGSATADYKGCC